MRQTHLTYQVVEFIPEQLMEGVLYVSPRYGTAVHKCCCGCGEEVVTPIGPTDWSMRIEKGLVTLYPSIGNWSYACRSHYLIRQGKVIWAISMSQKQIDRGRAFDQAAKEAYFNEVNRRGIEPPLASNGSTEVSHADVPSSLWTTVTGWWHGWPKGRGK